MKVEFQERHIQAQDRLSTLDRQIQEFRSHSEGTTQGVMADTDNIKVYTFDQILFISFLLNEAKNNSDFYTTDIILDGIS